MSAERAAVGEDQPEREGQERRPTGWLTAAAYASLGIEMGISIFIGWLAGDWLDAKLGTRPWLTLLLLLCGIAAAFRAVIRVGRQARRALGEQDAGDGKR